MISFFYFAILYSIIKSYSNKLSTYLSKIFHLSSLQLNIKLKVKKSTILIYQSVKSLMIQI